VKSNGPRSACGPLVIPSTLENCGISYLPFLFFKVCGENSLYKVMEEDVAWK
jgi:hypothetical protein